MRSERLIMTTGGFAKPGVLWRTFSGSVKGLKSLFDGVSDLLARLRNPLESSLSGDLNKRKKIFF